MIWQNFSVFGRFTGNITGHHTAHKPKEKPKKTLGNYKIILHTNFALLIKNDPVLEN